MLRLSPPPTPRPHGLSTLRTSEHAPSRESKSTRRPRRKGVTATAGWFRTFRSPTPENAAPGRRSDPLDKPGVSVPADASRNFPLGVNRAALPARASPSPPENRGGCAGRLRSATVPPMSPGSTWTPGAGSEGPSVWLVGSPPAPGPRSLTCPAHLPCSPAPPTCTAHLHRSILSSMCRQTG